MSSRGRKTGDGKGRYGGRTKGTPNKRTKELIEKLEAMGFDPVEAMVYVYRKARAEYRRADKVAVALMAYQTDHGLQTSRVDSSPQWLRIAGDMAKELMQYTHAKRKAVEVSGPNGKPIEHKDVSNLSDDELEARIAAAISKRGVSV